MSEAFQKTRWERLLWLLVSVGAILLIKWLDIWTGHEVSFSLFYLIPIGLTCWKVGRLRSMVVVGLSAIAWAQADSISGRVYSHAAIPFWNAVVRLSFFVIFTQLLSSLRSAIGREHDLARTDALTGAVNRRRFFETLMEELARTQRYGRGFALAYLDLDHFKKVNDQLGHATGDLVLKTIAEEMAMKLRRTDTIARLGGDEFALLLPETPPQAAELLISKLRFQLLDAMEAHDWPITFSIGLLNCGGEIQDEDALVKQVDQLMYDVKRDGRNNLRVANAA